MRFVLLVLALGLVGCEMSWQPRPKYKTPDAAGRKLVVVDAQGVALAKVRMRSDGTRVYGPDMLPIGMVVHDETGLGFQRRGEPVVYLESDPAGIWEFPGTLRIEPVGGGWAVFGASATLIGYVEFDGGWTYRLGYDDGAAWTLKERDVVSNSETVCSGWSGQVEPEMTLALCMEKLPVEIRALLGVWLRDQKRLVESSQK